MMYQDKLVVAIKSNGKILRENKDLVQLPFGSEFSVLVKNLNSRRAKFTLHIDGQDVLDGQDIIVDANSEVEMKRFIRNGNMNEGNAFKFIERTQAIEDGPRGIKMDDGVVRVEFWFEQEAPTIKTTYHRDVWWDEYYRYPKYFMRPPYYYTDGPVYGSVTTTANDLSNVKLGSTSAKTSGIMRGMSSAAAAGTPMNASATFSANAVSGTTASYNASVQQTTPTMDAAPAEVNEAGITVPGSKVEQKFTTVYGFNAEAVSHVIVLRMAGRAGTINIVTPVVARAKQKCSVCKHVNKANAKFCSECGTGLELV